MKDTRYDLKDIYSRAILAVNPVSSVKNNLRLKDKKLLLLSNKKKTIEFNLKDYKRIIVVGAGKATASMARAIEDMLGELIWGGVIVVKYGYTEKLDFIDTIEASHPVPDSNGVAGAKRILDILSESDENDLIISLISGGGSALMPLPPESISLEEKRATTDLLLKSGATIHEINSVRKHISLVKGGNLARISYPSTVINLMVSDVVGDNMDVIASGPFVPDNSTFSDARDILEKYNMINEVSSCILDYIEAGIDGKIKENPDTGSEVFNRVTNLIIASNIIALKAAKEEAEKKGYNTIILSSFVEGETKDVARMHSDIVREVLSSSNPVSIPGCIVSGGETTVTVRGGGLGGRNMEFAMHSAKYIRGYKNVLISSVGTDGTDGPTDAAGAMADGTTIERALKLNLDVNEFMRNNDSYNFFKQLGDLIITGPTNTNVMDVRIILVAD